MSKMRWGRIVIRFEDKSLRESFTQQLNNKQAFGGHIFWLSVKLIRFCEAIISRRRGSGGIGLWCQKEQLIKEGMPLQEHREEFSGAKQLFVSYCHEAKKHAYASSKEVMAP